MKVFHPHFSVYLTVIFLLSYGGAIFCLWYVPSVVWIQWLVSAALVINFIFNARRYLFLSAKKSIVEIKCFEKNWSFRVPTGDSVPALVLPDSRVTRYVIILNFKTRLTEKRLTSVLLLDSLSPDELRQLRVLLL